MQANALLKDHLFECGIRHNLTPKGSCNWCVFFNLRLTDGVLYGQALGPLQCVSAQFSRGKSMNAKQPGSEIPPTETIASAGWGTVFLIYALCVAAASCISQAVPVIGDIARYFHAPREQAGLVISLP